MCCLIKEKFYNTINKTDAGKKCLFVGGEVKTFREFWWFERDCDTGWANIAWEKSFLIKSLHAITLWIEEYSLFP